MQQREHWGSKLGFLMAAAGSAIGLGSLWKFPYVTGMNGGGLFVLCFLFFTFFIGAPIFAAELIIGRHAQKSPIGAFAELSNHSPHWKILGWVCVLSNFLILSFYSVVAGWAVNYTLLSLNQFTDNKTPQQIAGVFDTLYSSGEISLFWHFVFMLLTVGVVYGGIRKGIEYWAKLLTPALLVILVGLMIYSMTLNGFGEAVRFIIYPNFEGFKLSGILEALGLAFFTLSVGLGIMITYGSYLSKSDDIPKTVVTVSLMDVIVALMASLMIFPIIFTFGLEPAEGPGLLFKTMPVLFAKLPGTFLLSTLFFLLVTFTALTSAVSLMEVMTSTIIELVEWSRRKAVLIVGLIAFIFGIPSALAGSGSLFGSWESMYGRNFFDTVDYLTSNILLPITGFLIAIFAGWFLNKEISRNEFYQGTLWGKLFKIWWVSIRWIAPAAVLLVLFHKSGIINLNIF